MIEATLRLYVVIFEWENTHSNIDVADIFCYVQFYERR